MLQGDLSEMAFAHASPATLNPRPSTVRRNALVLTALAVAAAGCAGGDGLDSALSGSAAGVTNTASGALVVGSGPNAVEYECPTVVVRSGASAWQVADRDGSLRYQGSIGDLARECAIVNGNMTVKVGIEGRVLMGEKGTPGQLKVPVRIAVVHEGPNPKPITTKYFTVPLEIPQGQTQAAFTVVEDQIAFPLTKPGDIERYVIYVGYDPQGEPGGRATPARTSRPRPAAEADRPVRQARPAPRPAPAAESDAAPAATPAKPAAASKPAARPPDVFGPPPGATPAAPAFSPAPAKPQPTDVFGPPPGQ